MISHRNVISNVLQMATYESVARRGKGPGGKPLIDTVLGLLPQSHIYGLVMSYVTVYRGDETILLPKFDFQSLLQAIQE
jgi:acyl-CoA synthetase (AMP-forming)/AMP-acid ligase II